MVIKINTIVFGYLPADTHGLNLTFLLQVRILENIKGTLIRAESPRRETPLGNEIFKSKTPDIAWRMVIYSLSG